MDDRKRLIKETRRHTWLFVLIVFMTLIITGLGLVIPWIYREIINLVTNVITGEVTPEIWRSFWMWIVIFAVVGLLEKLFNMFRWMFTRLLRNKVFIYLNDKSLAHLMRLPVNYFEDNPIGFIGERLTRGINEIANLSTITLLDLLPAVLRFLGVLVIMMIFDFKLGLIFLIGVPLFVYITFVRAKILAKTQDKIRDQYEKLGRSIYQMISNIRLVKLFTQENFEDNRFTRLGKKLYKLIFVQEKYLRLYEVPREVVLEASYILVLSYGGYWVLKGVYTVGDLVLFIMYVQMTFNPLYRLTNMYDNYVRSMRSARRLYKIWDMPEEPTGEQFKNLKISGAGIEFKNISFAYKKKRLKGQGNILQNINLKIKPREVVALIGPSGVGKTTFIKLLTRFINPIFGSISIDGQRIDKVNYNSLRKNIAVVLQDEQTFSDTIRNNIKYGKPMTSDKKVVEATRIANIDEFINRLPKKLNTYIGERGVKLSGGERQRVAIARAILKDAPILVLDEATSSLDSESEKKIQNAMWELIKGRTTIIIAHRLSTIKKADKIIVLEKGRITEQGNHEQLMKRSGYYRRLFKMQGEMLIE